MEINEILKNLCVYDDRNPDFDKDNEGYSPPKQCFCDNCFYGRTKLATEILKLLKI